MNYFLTARDGFIDVYNGADNKIAQANDAKFLAYVFKTHKRDSVACSSSIDFCDEYGFENIGDAKKMITEAFKLI